MSTTFKMATKDGKQCRTIQTHYFWFWNSKAESVWVNVESWACNIRSGTTSSLGTLHIDQHRLKLRFYICSMRIQIKFICAIGPLSDPFCHPCIGNWTCGSTTLRLHTFPFLCRIRIVHIWNPSFRQPGELFYIKDWLRWLLTVKAA